MSKYEILLRVLDHIRQEGVRAGYTRYFPDPSSNDHANQARSRAYIHLFLKVSFGLLDFIEREKYITDGADDGGIDGYFIDADRKLIYFLQSKFRTTEANFETKRISIEEIVAMDIARVTSGETSNESGRSYNGKIQELIRSIARIGDISRYKYVVILIANIGRLKTTLLQKLTDGFPVEVFDGERCYQELVFPVVTGTYFNREDLNILLDLSNKNAGTKISYEVVTAVAPCEITVLFVPTLEIAKTMFRYRNAILKFNPRSYLELQGAKVNREIRNTMIAGQSNEFALLNNGITMLSDETNINERIGQRNKAQLSLRNPQIINGGQTAYTLSRLYEEHNANLTAVFENKEVLLKVITLLENDAIKSDPRAKQQLIERISTATNRQSEVTTADRHSTEEAFLKLQKLLFDRYGILVEIKRGEFQDGIKDGYINPGEILERNLFCRIFFVSNGLLNKARSKRVFTKFTVDEVLLNDLLALDRFYFGYLCYKQFRSTDGDIPNRKRQEALCQTFAACLRYFSPDSSALEANAQNVVTTFRKEWIDFIQYLTNKKGSRFVVYVGDDKGNQRSYFDKERWLVSDQVDRDIRKYFYQSPPVSTLDTTPT